MFKLKGWCKKGLFKNIIVWIGLNMLGLKYISPLGSRQSELGENFGIGCVGSNLVIEKSSIYHFFFIFVTS